jgi:hypothetical protein
MRPLLTARFGCARRSFQCRHPAGDAGRRGFELAEPNKGPQQPAGERLGGPPPLLGKSFSLVTIDEAGSRHRAEWELWRALSSQKPGSTPTGNGAEIPLCACPEGATRCRPGGAMAGRPDQSRPIGSVALRTIRL